MSHDAPAITRFLSSDFACRIQASTLQTIVAAICPQYIKATVHVHNVISGVKIGHVHVAVNASMQLRLTDVQTRAMNELTFETHMRKLVFFSAEAAKLPSNHVFQLAQPPRGPLRVGVTCQPFFWRAPDATRQQEPPITRRGNLLTAAMTPCRKTMFVLCVSGMCGMRLVNTNQHELHLECFAVRYCGVLNHGRFSQMLVHHSGTLAVIVSHDSQGHFYFGWYGTRESAALSDQYEQVVEDMYEPFATTRCKHVSIVLGQDPASCVVTIVKNNQDVLELTPSGSRVLVNAEGWRASAQSMDGRLFALSKKQRIVTLFARGVLGALDKILYVKTHEHPVCRFVFCPGDDLPRGTYRLATMFSHMLQVVVFTFDNHGNYSLTRTQVVRWEEQAQSRRILTVDWCRVSRKLLLLFEKSKHIIVVSVDDALTVRKIYSDTRRPSYARFAMLADRGETVIVGHCENIDLVCVE